jgi:hypothetical protein
MSKIFRLHKGGSETIRDWSKINSHLPESVIDSIEDPAGADSARQITSIPSPFARVDLARVAFKQVADSKNLHGSTIYHKIVSDCLDVGQIFFNLDALRNHIEVIAWDPGISMIGNDMKIEPTSDLGRLVNSTNDKHRLYGETLKTFLSQDRQTYNFSAIKRLYFLNYKNGPEPVNIIGGTSSSTLFFSSANTDLPSYVDVQFGADRVFDGKFCPLINRSADYILYLYSLRHSIPRFTTLFPELNSYLDQCFTHLDTYLKDEMRSFNDGAYLNTYLSRLPITFVDNPGNNVEVFGQPLRGKGKEDVQSDFEIASTKPVGSKPLVLPNEQFNGLLNYADGKWQHDYKAPYFDPLPLDKRALPHQSHITSPYLTVSDLLEPYIIKLPYPVDTGKFFNGHYPSDADGFVLPLKKEFFNYFSIADLGRPMHDGKRMFEILPLQKNAIKVILRIPIKAEGYYIEFYRNYTANQFSDKIQKPDEINNKGIIVDNQFGLSIFPFLKTGDDANAHYRVMFIDRDVHPLTKSNEYTLNFYKDAHGSIPVQPLDRKVRSNKHMQGQHASSFYYVLEKEFDFIEVRNSSGASGILIPSFRTVGGGNKKFSFAIDFGTTNTHIEYKVDHEKERPFEISEKDIQIGSLNYNDQTTTDLLKNPALGFGADILVKLIPLEFVPEKIEKHSSHSFPQRTVIADSDNFNVDSDSTYALADFNIPFTYLKETIPPQVEITGNLKWSDFKHDKKLKIRTERFMDTLLLLIRNKVLLNGGNLAETDIVWFYPSSMSEYRRGVFQSAWEELTKKYIRSNRPVRKMSESIAPFFYYKERAGTAAYDKPVACIDIGGGTTDIVIFKDNKPVYLTSFKYAANAIFGDGYGNSPGSNGFIAKYGPLLMKSLTSSSVKDLGQVLRDLENKHTRSSELIEFFFSIENNRRIRENNVPISFAKDLSQDTDMKIVFLFFYGSIIYHLANLMKVQGLEPPRFINFSGTGSKILNITDPSPGIKKLTEFTRMVFEDVYAVALTEPMEIKQFEDPKEITCKGGLLCTDYTGVDEVELKIKTVLLGDKNQTLVPVTAVSYKDLEKPELQQHVMEEVAGFIDRFFGWHDKYNFNGKFGINPLMFDKYREWLKEDMRQYLLAGIREKMEDVQESAASNVEETLFFYPLTGGLNKLAYNIQLNNH